MSFSIKLGNFLYKHAFMLYKPLYTGFKNKQDAFEIELLKKYVCKGDTVLDIGANIGYYATLLAQLTGEKGMVHCFEPDKQNFEHLQKTVAGFTNVRINNKAVGPKTETLKIYTSKNLNVDHRTYKPEEYDQEIEVQAMSIDDYLASDLKVNVIKMDIQGFEMHAIQGMEKVLAHNPQVKLISEFWPYGLKKAGSSVTEYFQYLTNKGFTCYLLEKKSLKKLSAEDVKQLEPLPEAHYFNILASRTDV